jgi:hypothetical protein
MWIILLGFGWSIAAGVASVLVSQLGFPYTWISPLSLAMIGAVAVLAYRGYAIQAWILAACVGIIAISAMAIARALTVPDPNLPEAYRREFDETIEASSFMGMDFPMYNESIGDYYIEYKPYQTDYLVFQGYDVYTPVIMEFPPLDTAGGQWAFKSGTVRLRGAVSATVEADPDQNWLHADDAVFESDQALRPAYPELNVAIPLPNNSLRGPMDIHAEMTVTYPQPDGEIEETTLTRDFTLSIMGAEYYQYYDRYTNWKRSRSVIERPILALLLGGSVLAGVGGVYLVRQGALRMYSSGGLQVVIRRLSGTQKLGLEVLSLDKFRDRTDATQGVFVGRVTAQSPGGRAGFRTGDILIEMAGKPTNSPRVVNQIAKARKKGESVTAVVLRDDARVELRVRF